MLFLSGSVAQEQAGCCSVAQSSLTCCDPMDYSLPGSLRPWDFPGKSTGVGCHCLLRAYLTVLYKCQLSLSNYCLCWVLPILGFPGGTSGKEPVCQCRRQKRFGFNPRVRKIAWRRTRQPTPVFLPGESHGQRSLVGYSPQRHKELDKTGVT